ncbi:MAG: hypothetical protein IJB11_00980 [Oscillospiraceae bacterium]|nr:hypothetical protein [Oscillospiraceae bacterium]
MRIGYIIILILSLLAKPREPLVLIIGQPCACMEGIEADYCQAGEPLRELLANRDYRWIIVMEPVENRQALAIYLFRIQPQANVILMEDQELAGKLRMYYAPDCCTVLEMLKKDEKVRWKNES